MPFWSLPMMLQAVAAPPGDFQAVVAPPRDLAPLLRPIAAEGGLPALGAVIVTAAGIEAIGATGVRSWGSRSRVTVADRWHLGSCTKAVTSLVAARLTDRGVLTWETTLGDVFGRTTPGMDSAWRSVSLLLLLSHRSGAALNFDDALWEGTVRAGGTPVRQRQALMAQALRSAPPSLPNTVTRYSNAGVIMAGAMLEALTGLAWEDLVRREVFQPLGMTHSGFGAPGRRGAVEQPLGHTRKGSGWAPVPVGPGADNPPVAGPTGTVHTTLADWARFAAAHLRGRRGDGSYLSAQGWRRLQEAGGVDWEYAPGWVVGRAPWATGPVLRHLGSNQFWVAEATIALDDDVAMLIVTNAADDSVEAPFKAALAALVANRAEHGGGERPARSIPRRPSQAPRRVRQP